MPLFRSEKQSKEAKKKFDDLYTNYQRDLDTIAIWDFSECELSELPEDVIEWLFMLNKRGLVLSKNYFSRIPENLFDKPFERLSLLDLSRNKLKSIPETIFDICSLLELNLSFNKLSYIPEVKALKSLQIINLSDNFFKDFPEGVCNISTLRKLDLSNNLIQSLPLSFSKLVKLKEFHIHGNPIGSKYDMKPLRVIFESINPFTTFELIENLPDDFDRSKVEDSNYLRRVLGASKSMVDFSIDFSSEIEEQDRVISEYLTRQKKDQKNLIAALLEMERKKDAEIDQMNRENDERKRQWLTVLMEFESRSRNSLEELLKMQERFKLSKEALQAKENERIQLENLARIQAEEYHTLQEERVRASMEAQLREMFQLERQAHLLDISRENEARQVLKDISEDNETLEKWAEINENDKERLMQRALRDEAVQKELVHQALIQQDVQRQQLMQQVQMIEQQLMQLTLLESRNRELQSQQDQMSALAHNRAQLSSLLERIHQDREEREKQIRQYLIEMERQKQADSDQYWLVQYQRVLQSKPLSVANSEFELEIDIVKFLNKCGAEDYVPVFAKHKMTQSALINLTDEDLRMMGMTEIGLRDTVLRAAADLRQTLSKQYEPSAPMEPEASAPPLPPPTTLELNTNGVPDAIRLEAECIVCMENSAEVVFFPCGHVCCCAKCARNYSTECVLCRQPITSSVRIHFPSSSQPGGGGGTPIASPA